MLKEKKYITTAIPYMNGTPHVGHAMDYCLADVCSRYLGLRGDEVRMQAGTDEHGSKIWQKAIDNNIAVQDFVDEKVEVFKEFIRNLDVSYTDFVRTTDIEHEKRVQKIWQKLSSHIYLSKYEGWYCSGCECFVAEKEYEENNGICPDHQKSYEKLSEENYYLRLADFKGRIREAIESDEMKILPDYRKKEILKLLEDSPDVSISRPKAQLTWGVPVPDDDNQVMYVWMDALANYVTVLGYPEKDISDWWPATAQFVGKDILRFHAIIWPAMLLGLGLHLPKTIISHGMVLSDGQKMSKSVGNIVDPMEVISKYGVDAFRYYFLRHVDTFADSDFSWRKFEDAHNNELANDLGNLVQRLSTLAAKNNFSLDSKIESKLSTEYVELMDKFEYNKAFDLVWSKIQNINKKIDESKPWSLAKNNEVEKLKQCLTDLVSDLLNATQELQPFLPSASKKIFEVFEGKIKSPKIPLFPKN